MNKKVTELDRKVLLKTRVFDLYEQKLRFERNGQEVSFYSLAAPDWVNIIALTPAQEVVMIRQYRAGVNDVVLEIPGGIMDPGEIDPALAASRELQEETGYSSNNVELLGAVHAKPALQNNRAHCFLAQDVKCQSGQHLDELEDITVELIPLREIPGLITRGIVSHAIVVAAFSLLQIKHRELF